MSETATISPKKSFTFLKDFGIGVGMVGLYFALQLWILPAAGVPT